jgi:hypothetical protein
LFAYETSAGAAVVTGALAHDPLGNGTLFPVVAVLPPGRRVTPGVDLSNPPGPKPQAPSLAPSTPPSAPAHTDTDPPKSGRLAPTSGCGGCAATRSSPRTPGWWWLALLGVWRRRASDSDDLRSARGVPHGAAPASAHRH